jgi:hypothetical protein
MRSQAEVRAMRDRWTQSRLTVHDFPGGARYRLEVTDIIAHDKGAQKIFD